MMEWNQLLIRHRLGKDTPEDPKTSRTCFQRDYDRLVFSSPFRRLKDKTQVFPLAKNDYVRTRLIHSIEVSCVGRSLGTIVGNKIIEKYKLENLSASDFGDIVAAACVAHDIGNPPFGHSGENAIRAAFNKFWDNHKNTEQPLFLSEKQKNDFGKFEGNAQGFRFLTRLEMQQRVGGMQLTYPTLAAFTKYPRESFIPQAIFNGYQGKSAEKHGFFQSEKELFKLVAEKVGLTPRSNEISWWVRHPLAFLVEAADDICYRIIDLEDSYRMEHISFKKAKKLLNSIACLPHSEQGADSKEEKIKHLRSLAINNLVNEIAEIFREKEESMLNGTFDGDLLTLSKYKDAFAVIKKEMQERVYNSTEVVSIEIAGYEVLGNLFSEFVGAVVDSSEKHSKSRLVKHMLPKQCRPTESEDCYSKMLKITDYISGMTDSYATTLFQKLKGISLS